MAANNPKRKPTAPQTPERLGFWELHLQPFLERHSVLLAIAFVLIASVRIVSTYSALSLTYDEPAHFACGLEVLTKHAYGYPTEHPPLAKVAIALLPYLDGARVGSEPDQVAEAHRILLASTNPDRLITLMRLGTLPFFWLACFVIFHWARRDFGKSVAVLATALFTLIPSVLAHAGLATTDMALTACLLAAYYALLVWAGAPRYRNAVFFGLAAGAAALSKFSAFGYLVAMAGFALLAYSIVRRRRFRDLMVEARVATFLVAVAVGAFVIWAAYLFSFGKVAAWGITLPAPKLFESLSVVLHHNEAGHNSYLLGNTSMTGWWYFFPVVLAVKTPLAVLLLAMAGLILCWRRPSLSGVMVVAAMAGILAPAMASHINIGVRHVLPIYGAMAILAAIGLVALLRRAPALSAVMLVWLAISGAVQHPDYLAYFNEIGSSTPERILVDSDLDWGQGVKILSADLRKRHAQHFTLYMHREYAALNPIYRLLPSAPLNDMQDPPPGWVAVSSTLAKHSPFSPRINGIDYESLRRAREGVQLPWYEVRDPTARVGGMLLYYFPETSH
jgi:hypothetical protein